MISTVFKDEILLLNKLLEEFLVGHKLKFIPIYFTIGVSSLADDKNTKSSYLYHSQLMPSSFIKVDHK